MDAFTTDIGAVDGTDFGRAEERARHPVVGLIFKVTSNHFQGKIDLSLIAFPPANVINK